MKQSRLLLENGREFLGLAPRGQTGTYFGEVVFTTGMTGYVESLTDPSYAGQILLFTYPLIGNYGVPPRSVWESAKIHPRGVVVSTACSDWSHHAGEESLEAWLAAQGVPLLVGVDTRAVTKLLRAAGTMAGAIADTRPASFHRFSSQVSVVSCREPVTYGKGSKRIVAVDCGMKENLLRELQRFPVEIVRVPYDFDYTQMDYDGLFLSNGPGDPTECHQTILHLKRAMQQKRPIFGVCLGTQLMALASGARTYKLTYGHRGHNQPCMDETTRRCYITSQNHGYAIAEESLSADWQVLFRNLNDQSVEGIMHRSLPFFSVQFHPEGAPGPMDTRWLFERFYACL